MIYISHLIPDEKMKFFVEKYGVGVESIDFSIRTTWISFPGL